MALLSYHSLLDGVLHENYAIFPPGYNRSILYCPSGFPQLKTDLASLIIRFSAKCPLYCGQLAVDREIQTEFPYVKDQSDECQNR